MGSDGMNCRHGEGPAHTSMHAAKWSELEKMWKSEEQITRDIRILVSRKVIMFGKNVSSHSFCLISLGHAGITDV
jgi:hypothetical protein